MSEALLDRYLPASVRDFIEQTYYARVNEQAKLENLIRDPALWQNVHTHPAFFSDHGVVHVRDVAQQILVVLESINGVLIPCRPPELLESFMNGYGVMLSYLHDIGMRDLSPFGRSMHPEFAAQAVFTEAFREVIDLIWDENCGDIAGRLLQLFDAGVLKRDPKIVFRELLSLSVGHSKSKVSIKVLNEPSAFRAHMQFILMHSLDDIYRKQQTEKGKSIAADIPAGENPIQFLNNFYSDFERDSFDWMVSDAQEAKSLLNDIIDVLRALRCADAFRQRGTVQKTSGGYEVFVSPQTGNALFALRLGSDKLYLMEIPEMLLSVGEANLASSEFSREGDLLLSFHRGAYNSNEAYHNAVYATAITVNDLLFDVVDSFWRKKAIRNVKDARDIQVLLESTDDNPRFTEQVEEQLLRLNPAVQDQVQIVPSLKNVSDAEREHYLKATELDWNTKKRKTVLENIRQAGQNIKNIDLVEGFKHIKLSELQAGDLLIKAGAPSTFVYIPLGDGLKIVPLGGYQSFSVAAWMPLGNTGVIRGDVRNADVVAEENVSILMIPKEIYLRYWYAPYSPNELRSLFFDDA